MPGKVSNASSNHQDGWPYRGPDSPGTKKIQRDKLRETTKTLHIAATTRRQLRALEEDTIPQEGMECLDKTRTIETSPEKENRVDKKVDSLTAKATLDQNALNCKITYWEYLM